MLAKQVQLGKHDFLLYPEDSIFVDEGDTVGVKILITSFSGRVDEFNDDRIIDHIEFEILIDIK